MGRVHCPICEERRHINDEGRDRCWLCGWLVPLNNKTGEYLPSSEWPAVGDQERRERRRRAERRLKAIG